MSAQPEEPGNVATLASVFDCEVITIYKLAQRGVIPKPAKGEPWNVPACTRKYIQYLRTRYSEGGKESRGRREKAEASIAEKKDLEMDGRLCDRAQMVSMLEDMITRGAAEIQRLKKLTPKQKEAVFTVLRSVSLPTIEEDAAAGQ